jgi:hypothetical protein
VAPAPPIGGTLSLRFGGATALDGVSFDVLVSAHIECNLSHILLVDAFKPEPGTSARST